LCSLKFAERCRKTELGSKAAASGNAGEVAKLKRLVEDLHAVRWPLRQMIVLLQIGKGV